MGEAEKIKFQLEFENLQNEMVWREKILKTKLQTLQAQFDSTNLEKLKLKKHVNQLESAIDQNEEELRQQNQNKDAMMYYQQQQPMVIQNYASAYRGYYQNSDELDQEISNL